MIEIEHQSQDYPDNTNLFLWIGMKLSHGSFRNSMSGMKNTWQLDETDYME